MCSKEVTGEISIILFAKNFYKRLIKEYPQDSRNKGGSQSNHENKVVKSELEAYWWAVSLSFSPCVPYLARVDLLVKKQQCSIRNAQI